MMKFQRRLQPQTRVDLVPMIDVVFQLVIFFMVSTTFIVTPGIGIVFPASATSEPVAVSRMVVTVVSREEIYLNKDRYDMNGFSQRLAEMSLDDAGLEGDAQKTVVLEGGEYISYKLLMEVFDVLRKNRYYAVNLKTRDLPGE